MRTLQTRQPDGRWRRDAALALRIFWMLVGYFVVGGRIRRRYRALEARGEVFWVDEAGPTAHREAPLGR